MRCKVLAVLFAFTLSACASSNVVQPSNRSGENTMPRPFSIYPEGQPLPTEGYDRPPAVRFTPTDFFIQPPEMRPFYGPPGEFGYYIDGADYGFESLSFIVTETHPGGGPDLHRHDSEEAHVLFAGKVTYLIGDRCFTVDGPYIARVPAGVPHTFMNSGTTPFHLMAVFPRGRPAYIHVAANPLVNGDHGVSPCADSPEK